MEQPTSEFVTFPVEDQQQIANALCEYFMVSEGDPSQSGLDAAYVKDTLNAMFRELVYQYSEAQENGDEKGMMTDDPNYTLGAFGEFVFRTCRFLEDIASPRLVKQAAQVDPGQFAKEGLGRIGWKPIPTRSSVGSEQPDTTREAA